MKTCFWTVRIVPLFPTRTVVPLFPTRTVLFELELSFSNSNCPFRKLSFSKTVLFELELSFSNSNCLPRAAPSHALYESLTAVERVSYCLEKAALLGPLFRPRIVFSNSNCLEHASKGRRFAPIGNEVAKPRRTLYTNPLRLSSGFHTVWKRPSSFSNLNCSFRRTLTAVKRVSYPLFRTRSHGCPFIIRTRTSSSGRGSRGRSPLGQGVRGTKSPCGGNLPSPIFLSVSSEMLGRSRMPMPAKRASTAFQIIDFCHPSTFVASEL